PRHCSSTDTLFFSHLPSPLRYSPSFPTRRSSDLVLRQSAKQSEALRCKRRAAGLPLPALSGRRRSVNYGHNPVYIVQNIRRRIQDRKSTRLNSSHVSISYAVFCLKKKKKNNSTMK